MGPLQTGTPTRLSTGLSASARLGLTRLYAASESLTLPPQQRDSVRASEATVDNLRTYLDEFIQGTASAEAAAALDDFADKPLVVLTADRGNRPGWVASQDRLATLSTNTAHRVVDGATHQSLIADEGDAGATSRAILDVVSSVRSGRPLSP